MTLVKKQMSPDQALTILKTRMKKPNLEIAFCRDYGNSYALFVRSGNESKEEIVRNCKVVNKDTGKVTDFAASGLDNRNWKPRFDYGDKSWLTMQMKKGLI